MDVDSGELMAQGLSMPHSPRWYAGRLWVCESGAGTLGFIDPRTGRYEADRRDAGVHPRAGLRRRPGLRRALAGARDGRLQRHPDHRAAHGRGADLRRLRGRHRPRASRSRSCGSRRACRRSSPCRCCPAGGIPELINDDAKLLENSFVVPDAALADVPAALRGV